MVFLVGERGRAAAAAAGFGLVFFGVVLWWIRLFGVQAFVALVIVESLYLVGVLELARLAATGLRPGIRFLAFPAGFVVAEYLRGAFPLGGLTWGGIGYSQHDNTWVLRTASLGGVWGVAIIVTLVAALVADAILSMRRSRRRSALLVAAAVAVLLASGLVPVTDPAGPQLRLAMVQGNAPEDLDDPNADDRIVFDNHLRVTRRAGGRVDLVVWPESSIEGDLPEDRQVIAKLAELVRGMGTYLHAGASLDAPGERFENVSLFFGPHGAEVQRYVKMHLVPFGEYVPARRFFEPLAAQLQRVPRDGVPGTEAVVFSLPQGGFASVICFESTFPRVVRSFVRRGAELLVVSTNNSSFERTAASRQHVAFSQLRAAEHRMWVAHTALTGISAVIDPSGRILEETSLFEPDLLTPQVRMQQSPTLYARLGDWVPLAAAAWIAALLILRFVKSHGPESDGVRGRS